MSPAENLTRGVLGRASAALSLGLYMKTIVEILEVNPPKTGVAKSGKPYSITECECIVTDAQGVRKVGVLTLSRELDGKVTPGLYEGTFDISVDYRDRKIGAQIVGLEPVKRGAGVGAPPK